MELSGGFANCPSQAQQTDADDDDDAAEEDSANTTIKCHSGNCRVRCFVTPFSGKDRMADADAAVAAACLSSGSSSNQVSVSVRCLAQPVSPFLLIIVPLSRVTRNSA